jgi:flagellar biosynthesis/type III secretory pathway M-ring protein FliF/YscJ
MSDNYYTTIKIITRPDGSIENLDFSSYVPDNDAVSAMMQPIIDAVAATAKEDLQQRQQGREQGRELFAMMMRESAKESAEGKAVDAAESAERAAEAAEMTGSDETDKTAEVDAAESADGKAVDAAIAWLAQKMKPEKVATIIKGWVKANS